MKKHKRLKTKSKATNPLHDPQPDAAGVDIAANEIWAAVPPERTEKSVRRFGAFTQELKELVKWLLDCGVRSVAMESTGVYGTQGSAKPPPWAILCRGFRLRESKQR